MPSPMSFVQLVELWKELKRFENFDSPAKKHRRETKHPNLQFSQKFVNPEKDFSQFQKPPRKPGLTFRLRFVSRRRSWRQKSIFVKVLKFSILAFYLPRCTWLG